MPLNNYKEECGIIVKFWEDHFDEYRDSFVRKGSLEPVIEDLVVTVYMKKCEQILAYSWLQHGGWHSGRGTCQEGQQDLWLPEQHSGMIVAWFIYRESTERGQDWEWKMWVLFCTCCVRGSFKIQKWVEMLISVTYMLEDINFCVTYVT